MVEGLEKKLKKAIKKALDAEPVEYDGIQGVLPHWILNVRKREFAACSSKLLKMYSVSELLTFKNNYRETMLEIGPKGVLHHRNGLHTGGGYPWQIENDLDFLCRLEFCISLGETKGLELLDGINVADAAKGKKFREGPKNIHLSNEAKDERDEKFQRVLEEVHMEHPRWKLTAVREETADRCNVSAKSIQRYTRKTW